MLVCKWKFVHPAPPSYLDCLRLGIDVPKGGPIIHGLVGVSIQQNGLYALLPLADRLDAGSAAAAAREMARLDARGTTAADSLAWERDGSLAGLNELLRRAFETIRAHDDGRLRS